MSGSESNGPLPGSRSVQRAILWFCVLFTVLAAVYPVARAAFRAEIDYNEGWNIYNAQRVANHLQLYPQAYGWQTVNYPMLSFALLAFLHRFTHEYLFTGRALALLSLLACCTLVAAIVRQLSDDLRAALLAGLFCLAVFCTAADNYVGMVDPQLLAQVFFLLGFFVYLRGRQSLAAIAAAAALFVLGGSIKHNPLDFPVTVLIDLLLVSRLRALWFSVCGLAIAAISVLLNLRFGGTYFLAQMLAPRVFHWAQSFASLRDGLGPLLIPVVCAVVASFVLVRDPRRRIAAILLFASLALGAFFGGGTGVSINTFFSAFFAVCIVLGVTLADTPKRSFAAPLLFLWLVIPAAVAGIANPVGMLRKLPADQRRFDTEVAFLRNHPGPAVCESLLRCFLADKPYLYDPFNATRLINFHKLDPGPMLDDFHHHRIAAVQFDQPLGGTAEKERFPSILILTIREAYQPALVDEDVAIYLPKPSTTNTSAR